MKALLVIIAAALPLSILTVMNLLPAKSDSADDRPNVASGAAPQPKIEEAAALAEKLAARSRAEREVIDQLIATNLYSTKIVPALSPPQEVPPSLAPLLASWTEIQKAQTDLLAYLDVYRGKPAPDVELSRLAALRSKQAFRGDSGGNEIADRLVDARIQALEQHNSSEQLLERAQTAFRAQHFDDTLKALEQIASDSVNSTEKGQIDELRRRATFWRHWGGRPLNREISQLRLDKLNDLRERTPAAVLSDETAQLKKIDEEIAQLGRQIRLADFLNSPPTRLRELLAESRELLAADPKVAGRLRTKLEEWIEQHLPEKPLPKSSLLIKEAWKKNGSLLKGVFLEGSEANAKTVWYQYWSTEEAYRRKQAYEQTVYLTSLKGPPEAPPDVRTVEEFARARRTLFEKLDSQQAWQEFAATCERLNRELDEYRQAGGAISGSLSFDREQKTAQEVLSNWADSKSLWDR